VFAGRAPCGVEGKKRRPAIWPQTQRPNCLPSPLEAKSPGQRLEKAPGAARPEKMPAAVRPKNKLEKRPPGEPLGRLGRAARGVLFAREPGRRSGRPLAPNSAGAARGRRSPPRLFIRASGRLHLTKSPCPPRLALSAPWGKGPPPPPLRPGPVAARAC
jgi:hypothetical protein